ncbi:MAG: TraB/GumN family protein [Aquabacterium sp.]|nr:MAG: TraB/GumN family protein [Aquabacterium sp.]
MTRRLTLAALGLFLACSLSGVRAEEARAACPAPAQPPTQQQLEAGMRHARDHGLLWKLQRDGRTSWLYGTLHVGRMEWVFPGPALRTALRGSRRMALELDISDPKLVQQLSLLPAGIPMPAVPAPLRRRMDAQATAACVDPAALARLHPVLEATAYTLFAARRENLDPAWGLEAMLAGYARGSKLPIVSLETPDSQLRALLPTNPEEALDMVDNILGQLETGRASVLMARLASAWERGDLAELSSYEDWCECTRTDTERASMRALLDERNPALAEGIATLHAREPVFAAVGALHMVGPQGLPQLLQARGFTVERVEFAREAARATAAASAP